MVLSYLAYWQFGANFKCGPTGLILAQLLQQNEGCRVSTCQLSIGDPLRVLTFTKIYRLSSSTQSGFGKETWRRRWLRRNTRLRSREGIGKTVPVWVRHCSRSCGLEALNSVVPSIYCLVSRPPFLPPLTPPTTPTPPTTLTPPSLVRHHLRYRLIALPLPLPLHASIYI